MSTYFLLAIGLRGKKKKRDIKGDLYLKGSDTERGLDLSLIRTEKIGEILQKATFFPWCPPKMTTFLCRVELLEFSVSQSLPADEHQR